MTPGLPGYDLVFADDFDGDRDTSSWSRYEGHPEGRRESTWRPANLLCGNASLTLRTTRGQDGWDCGGSSNARAGAQTCGARAFRLRAQPGNGLGCAFLLHPLGDGTPLPWAVPDDRPPWFGLQAHAGDGATDAFSPAVCDVEVDGVARYARSGQDPA